MLPTSHEIWIGILRLEETGNDGGPDGLMDRGVRKLEEFGGMPSCENWIEEAARGEMQI